MAAVTQQLIMYRAEKMFYERKSIEEEDIFTHDVSHLKTKIRSM